MKQDRLRGFEMVFLTNYCLDYSHNEAKYEKQKENIEKNLTISGRDPETWRAITDLKNKNDGEIKY